MGSFIDEVDEDLRGDRMQTLWRRWRWGLFGAAGCFVFAVAAWEGLSAWRDSRQETDMLAYRSALKVSDDAFTEWREEQDAAAEAAAEAAAADGDEPPASLPENVPLDSIGEGLSVGLGESLQSGVDASVSDEELRRELGIVDLHYDEDKLSGIVPLADDSVLGVRLMSLLQLAIRHYESERYAEADAAWRRVITDEEFPPLYRDLARVLRANAMLGRPEAENLRADLDLLANDSDNPFWSTATEILALLHLQEDNIFEARGHLEALNDDENESVPRGMRRRASRLLTLLDERELDLEEIKAERAAAIAAAEEAGEGEGDEEVVAEDSEDSDDTEGSEASE
ncbi:MAG: hypothetical protein MPJ52_01690 [Alphaproteobacteria bacterium]|nr:hypothetical protein [Alphaproteobacteria bacterium]MDA7987500.1 hypothetical protein [Alphaproteobacteria bacterium]